jgi:hypothetical protein
MSADKVPSDPARWIPGANVSLTSQDIFALRMHGTADSNGIVRFSNVPAGKYFYTVESSSYMAVSGAVAVESGLNKTIEVFMPTSMVTYTWSVTPTTIQDKYDMTVSMTFRTDVPAPVITISPPIVVMKMEGGQTAYAQYTIKNEGMISAFNFNLKPSNSNPAVKIEVPYTVIPEIKPGQSITVPVKISLEHASCEDAVIEHTCQYMCAAGIWTSIATQAAKFLVGDNKCPTVPPAAQTVTPIGPAGWWSYVGVGAALIPAQVVPVNTCGTHCISGTTLGCTECKRCVSGDCVPDEGGPCKGNDLCKAYQCTLVGSDMACEGTPSDAAKALYNDSNYSWKDKEAEFVKGCPGRTSKDPSVQVSTDGCSVPFWLAVSADFFTVPLYQHFFDKDQPLQYGPSFKEDCDQHDKCYGDCSKSKGTCDSQLDSALDATCENGNPFLRDDCKLIAKIYVKAVSQLGGSNYNTAQAGSCKCCP